MGAGSLSVAPLPGKTSPCVRRPLTESGKCAMLIFGSALSISESRLQMLIKCHPCPRTFVTHESGPYTAVGGITLSRRCHCRLDFKYPPTAVGGITLSRRCHVGWTLSIHRLPSVGLL